MKLFLFGPVILGTGSRLGASWKEKLQKGVLSLVLPRAAPDHPIVRLAMPNPQPALGALRNAAPGQLPDVTHVHALHRRQGKLTHLLDGTVIAGSRVDG